MMAMATTQIQRVGAILVIAHNGGDGNRGGGGNAVGGGDVGSRGEAFALLDQTTLSYKANASPLRHRCVMAFNWHAMMNNRRTTVPDRRVTMTNQCIPMIHRRSVVSGRLP
jgi:hypothetical protein